MLLFKKHTRTSKHENKPDSWRKDEELKKESNGELDLSMKSSANKSFSPTFLVPLRS
jgi:hypothetical protein